MSILRSLEFLYGYSFILLIFLIRIVISLFFSIKSPLLTSLTLILVSSLMGVYAAILSRKWITYLIVLLFLGGIIVLFVYITTLITRFKSMVKFPSSVSFLIIFFLWVVIIINFLVTWRYQIQLKISCLSIIYIQSNVVLVGFLAVYLLFCLIIVIKISQKFKGTLKSKLNDI